MHVASFFLSLADSVNRNDPILLNFLANDKKKQVVISVAAALNEPAWPFGAHGDQATTKCRVSGTTIY